MSYYLQIGTAAPADLASNVGYGDLGEWIESLPAGAFGELVHLYDHGWSQDPAALESQLAAALKGHAPDARDVGDTAAGLLELLHGRDPSAEVVSVTDGIGTDDGTEPPEQQ